MSAERGLSSDRVRTFRETVYGHFDEYGRSLPWRETHDPYSIMVSEVMLQQTQAKRVIAKYREFLAAFPDFAALARAPLEGILRTWQGLGYNRRVLYLKKSAQAVISEHNGNLARNLDSLMKLPGIGRATASAILAFAFNEPTVFVETNIRAAFIHFFFHDRSDITDKEIYPLVAATLDRSDPRKWYYALMDYGVMVKKEFQNPDRKSAHYRRQSPFQGSDRQIRGMVLRIVLEEPQASLLELSQKLEIDQEKFKRIIRALKEEGFIQTIGRNFSIG